MVSTVICEGVWMPVNLLLSSCQVGCLSVNRTQTYVGLLPPLAYVPCSSLVPLSAGAMVFFSVQGRLLPWVPPNSNILCVCSGVFRVGLGPLTRATEHIFLLGSLTNHISTLMQIHNRGLGPGIPRYSGMVHVKLQCQPYMTENIFNLHRFCF